ncbi:MAG: hypothetical protein AAGJ55_12250, partial [Cyanobacteria bacterium J06555_12]
QTSFRLRNGVQLHEGSSSDQLRNIVGNIHGWVGRGSDAVGREKTGPKKTGPKKTESEQD